jgi:hypothetical protein
MGNRPIVRVACLLVLLGVLGGSAARVAADDWNKTYFTFSAPVRLPGVLLPAGSYVFDRPSPYTESTLVRVRDRNSPKVHLIVFTRLVHRRLDGKLEPTITLGEALKGSPRPVSVWFAQGQTLGHQFIY